MIVYLENVFGALGGSLALLACEKEGSVISAGGPYSTHAFTFDHVYDVSASQKKVFTVFRLLSLSLKRCQMLHLYCLLSTSTKRLMHTRKKH